MPRLPDDVVRPLYRIIRHLSGEPVEGFDPKNYNGGTGADFSSQVTLLSIFLQVAVPLHFLEMQELEDSLTDEQFTRRVQADAENCANLLAEKGDLLMFCGKKRGETAMVFNALARGIALMSMCPGGVKVFGTHWEYRVERVDVGGQR